MERERVREGERERGKRESREREREEKGQQKKPNKYSLLYINEYEIIVKKKKYNTLLGAHLFVFINWAHPFMVNGFTKL